MEFTTEMWAALGVAGTTIAGAVAYLVKPGLDANRARQVILEQDAREVAQLQKDYIKTATESSMQNAATNAKQAADLSNQTQAIAKIDVVCQTTAQKTEQIHLAFSEFVHIGRLLIQELSNVEARRAAAEKLTEIVAILHNRPR